MKKYRTLFVFLVSRPANRHKLRSEIKRRVKHNLMQRPTLLLLFVEYQLYFPGRPNGRIQNSKKTVIKNENVESKIQMKETKL